MKLTRIMVKDLSGKSFLKGKTYDFVPKKVIPLIGKNGAGKSSLIDLLNWCIAGGKISTDDVEVHIALDPTFEICRIKQDGKALCFLNGNKVTEKALNAAIEDCVGISVDNIRMSSFEPALATRKPEEILGVLLNYTSDKLTCAKLASYIPTAKLTAGVQGKINDSFSSASFTISEVDKVHKVWFADRRSKSAQLKSWTTEYDRLKAGTTVPKRTIEKVEADIVDVHTEIKRKAEAEKRDADYKKAVAAEADRKTKMDEIKAKATGISYKGHTVAEQKAMEENRAQAESRKLKLTAETATIEGNNETQMRILKELDQQTCPISKKLICTTDKTGIKGDIEKLVESNNKLIADLKMQMKSCDEVLESYKAWKKQVDEDMTKYQEKTALIAEYKALKEHPIVIPEKPVLLDASAAAAKETALMAERDNCRSYDKMQALAKQIKALQEEVDTLDYLVSAFGDKGVVKEAIIRDYLSIFEKVMNDRAMEFCPGYSVSLSVDGGLKVALKTPYNKQAYDTSLLSSGESLIARVLMLDMLNQLTGTNLMFIDNVEALDEEALKRLVEMVNSEAFSKLYDHVFIAGVDHPDVKALFS